MATLDFLKKALREKVATTSSPKQPLSDAQYNAGFDIIVKGSERATYEDFIVPELTHLLTPLFDSRTHISVLEIGPGPKSILEHLPSRMRWKIKTYDAFEPNIFHATSLEESLYPSAEVERPLPCLENLPKIYRDSFTLDHSDRGAVTGMSDTRGYDVVLFCHSMYGMSPKPKFIERALQLLDGRLRDGMVVVFHRDDTLHLPGLVCHRTSSFPDGVISVMSDDQSVGCFAAFVAGCTMQDADVDKAVRNEWRKLCRDSARYDQTHTGHLLFSSPNVMMAFTRHATTLGELTTHVPLAREGKPIKNRESCHRHPAAIVRPTEIRHVQRCVRWALEHEVSLTVLGGSHSSQCIQPGVVSIDMSSFNQVHVVKGREDKGTTWSSDSLVVAEGGCVTGDIISKSMAAGLTVPLGARPSVGAGLWLQGGIGHLARLHGLACDAIIGAVIVSVDSGQLLCVGHVPSQHQPAGSERPENEADLLWAMKGAGTNFGIVISVTFKAYAAPTFLVRNWVFPLSDRLGMRRKLIDFDKLVARKLPRNCSADAYLYWDAGQLHLGVTMFEPSIAKLTSETSTPAPAFVTAILGTEDSFKIVDCVGLFDAEMYVSGMHGGHGGGKTSSFKRCLFLNDMGSAGIADALVRAVETRPSHLCYLHLLHGGGAAADIAADATAFGCRDWSLACVITGVWPRDQDGTEPARAAMRWVYDVVRDLLPLCSGAYGADLGPDPRDAALASKAFGQNMPRLARLKRELDPSHVLAYACPISKAPRDPKLILLVTGEICAGKDYCANVWVSVFVNAGLTARVVSISDATKREYAAATGADLERILLDRAYKEQHRPALTGFFLEQVRQRPRLREEHFLDVVHSAGDLDVLLISGMREEAPVPTLSHLVPESRLLELRVETSQDMRLARGDSQDNKESPDNVDTGDKDDNTPLTTLNYRPNFIFNNNTAGNEAIEKFAESYLLPFFHRDLQRLADMIRPVSNFPRQGIKFRHVLDISQQPGGLALCASLFRKHFAGNWASIAAVVSCEAGGFVFASALAAQVNLPLALIREAGKLPPPTISVAKSTSHISSLGAKSIEKRIEMERDVISGGASVVVVDDVFATGKTLCAVLELLREAEINAENVTVMTVAEFPVHRGREELRKRGFGRVNIQSLLVYDGV
ncbi:phosphoribosyl transferase domain protein [Hypoxylon sp. FL1150]|nr:phosphoribosyl transferase domain protein [Hypoxylon sp. FL1150]